MFSDDAGVRGGTAGKGWEDNPVITDRFVDGRPTSGTDRRAGVCELTIERTGDPAADLASDGGSGPERGFTGLPAGGRSRSKSRHPSQRLISFRRRRARSSKD